MKLVGITTSKVTKDENGENVPRLEITEVVLIHCNVANNSYQQNSRVLYTFVPHKSFDHLLDTSTENFIFIKTLNILKYCLLIKILKKNLSRKYREKFLNIKTFLIFGLNFFHL